MFVGTLALVGCMTTPATNWTNNKQKTDTNEAISEYFGNQLENGSSPYTGYYGFGEWNIHPHGNNSIIFRNIDNASDSIVFLERIFQTEEEIMGNKNISLIPMDDLLRGKVIRHNYIRAGSSYEMLGIPNGDYFIKVVMGQDWNPNKSLFDGKLNGGFDRNIYFNIFNNPSEFFHMNRYSDDEGTIHYTTYDVKFGKRVDK